MKLKDVLFISYLRQNGRESLTNLSKKTKIPISTLHDRLRFQQNKLITKHTALIDFPQLGYTTLVKLFLKFEKESRDEFYEFAKAHPAINSLYKVNNGFDYMLDLVFTNMYALEEFLDMLEERFSIRDKRMHFVIREEFKEKFLSNPQLLPPELA